MTDNMDNTLHDLRKLLGNLLTGASLKAFEWDSFYSVSFLLRDEKNMPPELQLTLCNHWFFQDSEKLVSKGEKVLTPLDGNDCARGYILAGIATKEVESVELRGEDIDIRFKGGVVMSIPTNNNDDPEEDAFVVKTPEWVSQNEQRYIEVGGNGAILIS